MKYFLIILLLAHALIHLMGFAKSFSIAQIPQLSHTIPKFSGVLFLIASGLFIVVIVQSFIGSDLWLVVAGLAIILSQILIVRYWEGTEIGTAVNLIILIVVLIGFTSRNLENEESQAIEGASTSNTTLTQQDIYKPAITRQQQFDYMML